jgi:hypothetical protein
MIHTIIEKYRKQLIEISGSNPGHTRWIASIEKERKEEPCYL